MTQVAHESPFTSLLNEFINSPEGQALGAEIYQATYNLETTVEERLATLRHDTQSRPENVAYDGQPQKYVNEAREVLTLAQQEVPNFDLATFNGRSSNMFRENGLYAKAASSWLQKQQKDRKLTSRSAQDVELRVQPFLERTLEAFGSAPKLLAAARYITARDQILAPLPATKKSIAYALRSGRISISKIEELESTVDTLPHTLPIADLARMTPDERMAIVDIVGNQCLEVYRFASKYQIAYLLSKIDVPVLRYDVSELHKLFGELNDAPQALQQFFDGRPKQQMHGEVNKQLQRDQFTALEEGEMMRLSPTNGKIGVPKFRAVASSALRAIGVQLSDLHFDLVPSFYTSEWQENNPIELLAGNFIGNFAHAYLMAMKADRQTVQEMLPDCDPRTVPLNAMRRYLLVASLSSMGRQPVPHAVETLVYTRLRANGESPLIGLRTHRHIVGQQVVRSVVGQGSIVSRTSTIPGIMIPTTGRNQYASDTHK